MKERQRWQPEEDALLRAYVKQYGPKEWSLVSQRMNNPLDRDPKSCLERWKNYLKPGIKKGSLTPEEQSLVISLQAKYGNKWKKIAAEVPGRTAKRLGKWWEVFKEKQLKQLHKSNNKSRTDHNHQSSGSISSETAAPGKYDHILETFAEKYVQSSDPVNSSTAALPPWMISTPTATSSSSSSSTSLTLSSPSDPAVLDPIVGPVTVLVQHCRELEEGKESWLRHKKEATWRLNRLEQQLESEKARRRREKTEEIEARIELLREEELAFVSRMEGECREQLNALQREAEAKEARLMEAWCCSHLKMMRLVQQIGAHHGSH